MEKMDFLRYQEKYMYKCYRCGKTYTFNSPPKPLSCPDETCNGPLTFIQKYSFGGMR